MIEIKNFPRAYVEVIEILKLLEHNEFEKIDNSFIDMLNRKKDTKYTYSYDYTKDIEEQTLLKETRAVLAYIFMNYLGTSEEKEVINRKFKNDIEKDEQLKREKYSVDVFKNKKIESNTETQMIVYEKENLIKKFIKIIKKFLKF